MNKATRNPTAAERALDSTLSALQRRVAANWRGLEKTAVIELVRSLDSMAVAAYLRPSDSADEQAARAYRRMGAAAALRPILAGVHGVGGGVPWGKSSLEFARFFDSYLEECGKLTHLRRFAALERSGVVSTSMSSDECLLIETLWGAPELAAVYAGRAVKRKETAALRATEVRPQQGKLQERMRSYVERDPLYLIRYDNDIEIVSAYRQTASLHARRSLEGEALPSEAPIGGRTFGEWKEACEQALGRVLCHIDFALLLAEKYPGEVVPRDVLTIFARREDIAAVWLEAGLPPQRLTSTIDALSLSVEGLDDWEQAYEIPTPFYVDMGRDFVLLPLFGALINPYFALFRHLRRVYKPAWDRAVEGREAVFRSDLARRFASPRFLVPARGFRLRRSDGTTLTDIDALIFDRREGSLALVQLKWHDAVGYSASERASRRKNIEEANRWVSRVHGWIDNRSCNDVLSALDIDGSGSMQPPKLYVIARYVARFSGASQLDPRAAWLGWPEIINVLDGCHEDDPLDAIPRLAAAYAAQFTQKADVNEEFRFPGLTVNVRVASSLR